MNILKKTAMTAVAAVALAGPAFAQGSSSQSWTIGYQGILEAGGAPYEHGTLPLSFFISDAATGGQTLATTGTVYVDIDPETGLFSTELTFDQIAGRPVAFGEGDRWLGVAVGAQTLSPRTRLRPAPLALDVVESVKPWTLYPETGNVGINAPGDVCIGDVALKQSGEVSANEINANVIRIAGGSDIAEPFNIGGEPEPGMVVCIDPARVGELRLADRAYDRTVAGVVSGAGGVNPGMTLTQAGTEADGEHPVALTGRVWCFVDAGANGPVEAGDLLTTSDTPGHAMRVCDTDKANGAIIGKAMSSLEHGRGLVLVLVNLQ